MKFTLTLVPILAVAAHAGSLLNGNTAATTSLTSGGSLVVAFTEGSTPANFRFMSEAAEVESDGTSAILYMDENNVLVKDWNISEETKPKSKMALAKNGDNELTADGDASNWYLCDEFEGTNSVLFYGKKEGLQCQSVKSISYKPATDD